MGADEQIDLVERYFAAVDGEDLPGVRAVLAPDCVFTVETHGVRLEGHDEISGMFHRLWGNHAAVRHHAFVHVPDPSGGRIASRFAVENTESDGSVTRKSNCNFFEISQGKFRAVAVYMAGPNTLDGTK
jgi:ketosteroid isomerase-like protein